MRKKKAPPTISISASEERAEIGWLISTLVRSLGTQDPAPPACCAQPATAGTPRDAFNQRESAPREVSAHTTRERRIT